jgi:hypothetical protein
MERVTNKEHLKGMQIPRKRLTDLHAGSGGACLARKTRAGKLNNEESQLGIHIWDRILKGPR